MPMARTCSATPKRSNSGRLAGSSDSPMWKRGWRAFSSNRHAMALLAHNAPRSSRLGRRR